MAYKPFESDPDIEREVRAALGQVNFSDVQFFTSGLAHAFAARNSNQEVRTSHFAVPMPMIRQTSPLMRK
jgi:hypothetical protein